MYSAKVIAHSKTVKTGIEVITYELEYPRYIHAEMKTHRVFSSNSASSRAIPVEKLITQALDNSVEPMWTLKQAGMQGPLITEMEKLHTANDIWLEALHSAVEAARRLDELGIHKQNINRILEPFTHIKTVLTVVDLDNFFNLRCHQDAQPEIQMIANLMMVRKQMSEPKDLWDGDWHTPYASDVEDTTLARKISSSCCAQVSYRNSDDSAEKAEVMFDRLVNSVPIHASPFEHQVTPLGNGVQKGNLRGFKQYRELIEQGLGI